MPNQRYKLTIAYRGTNYHGWQMQTAIEVYQSAPPAEVERLPTVQGALVRAIQSIVGHRINLVGSSRTDAGVHAKGQLAHFDTDQLQIPPKGLRHAVNARLPADILIRTLEPVPDAFDAITATLTKRYQYVIWNSTDRPNFFPDLVWHRWHELDIAAMREAAAVFVGEHDFASFAKPGHGRDSTIRTVFGCDVSRRGPRLVIGIEGSGFLWNMVRIIVGTLVEVGMGKYGASEIRQMLHAKAREAAGPTAPPEGLYLQWIKTRPIDEPVALEREHQDETV